MVYMKKNKLILLLAAAIMVLLIGLICTMSVIRVLGQGGGNMLLFSFGGKAELRNTIEIPVSEVNSLKLVYRSKNIKVYPSKDDAVTVKEYLYSNSPAAKASVTRGNGKEVLIEGGQTHTFVLFGFFWGEGERIEVYVPEKALEAFWVETGSGNITSRSGRVEAKKSIQAKAGSGNIKWQDGAAEEISIQAGSGNLNVEGLKGNINLQTGSGNISGEALEGKLNVSAGSGNVTLKEVSGSGKVKAGSGNVKVEAVSVTGDIEIQTQSGNNSLEIPGDLNFYFQAETGSGNIHTDFEEQLSYNQKGNHGEGNVGDENALTISMKAGSGNVRVRRR